MAKTLSNGLSMIKTNPLNHNWLDLVGVAIAPVSKKKLLLNAEYKFTGFFLLKSMEQQGKASYH